MLGLGFFGVLVFGLWDLRAQGLGFKGGVAMKPTSSNLSARKLSPKSLQPSVEGLGLV